MKLEELEKNGLCGLIFDCDGVMIDSADANRRFYNLVLHGLGLPPMKKEMEAYAFMATAAEALQAMVPEALWPEIGAAVKKYVNYKQDVLPHVKLMPGFRQFVEMAAKRGYNLAIDTNRTEEGIWYILDFFSLGQYFEPVICASNALPKPSPEGAEKICRQWGAAPEQALFVGDSENDRKTAKGAGTLFAAFGGKGLEGDLEAANYEIFANMLRNVPAVRCKAQGKRK